MSATSLPRMTGDSALPVACRHEGSIVMPLNPSPFNAPLALSLSCHFPFSHFHFLPSLTPFRINTYEISRKCCKQRTYRIAKSFICNTYKKHGGWGVLWLTRNPMKDVCPVYPEPRRERAFGARDLSRKEQLAAPGLVENLGVPAGHGALAAGHCSFNPRTRIPQTRRAEFPARAFAQLREHALATRQL